MLSIFTDTFLGLVIDLVPFSLSSDSERLTKIQKAYSKSTSAHDDTLIDSNKSYLLLHTNNGLYLISRNSSWKHKLNDSETSMYTKLGRRAFFSIRRKSNQLA